MCITTMLFMGVYLKTITKIILPTSEVAPLIGVYYVVSLFIVCLATVFNVWTLNLHNKGLGNKAERVSPWIQKWILGFLAKGLFIKIQQPDSIAELNPPDTTDEEQDELAVDYMTSDRAPEKKFNIKKHLKNLRSRSHNTAGELNKRQQSSEKLLRNSMNSIADKVGPSPKVHFCSPQCHKSSDMQPLKETTEAGACHASNAHKIPGGARRVSPMRKSESELMSVVRAEFEYRFQKVLKKVYRTIEQNEMRQAMQEERGMIMWEWKQLAEIVDRVLLWLFLLATTLATFFILFKPALFQEQSHVY